MSFNATDDNLVLVAPRPVRLAASFSPVLATRTNSAAFRVLSTTPTDALDRIKFADDNQDTKDGQPEHAAARMSPRASLPSEALEEFLSILRPSSFIYSSPTSPILRRRNNGAMIPFDRQQSTRRSENAWSPQPPSPNRATSSVKTLTPDDLVSAERIDSDHDISTITWYPFDWRTGSSGATSSPLHSPVNRAQAHNPFGKRHSQQSITPENNADLGAFYGPSPPSPMFTRIMSPLELPVLSPSASLVSLSPAAVPLPSPSPDETAELDSVN
ncbi:hypothetical protein BJ322DRAFT_1104836 [Thelephora terrestris]|uniref:Uncharacterized protein n=1 Tax=Thelephora terrestris TaxID=56493 RepID=A0A9P6HN92_9AGAM|nr:hypothetical protein BJ322DRAFT_1104836 [Thelephora terrestris]